MQPYATSSEPSPLNGNRPNVNGNNSFFTEYRTQILYSIGFVIFVVFVAISTRGKYSWYETEKKSKKETRSVWTKAAATLEKKPKKDSKVKPAGKCPAGCVPAGVEKKKGPNLSKTSFDPALTNKKPKVEGTPQ